MYIFVAACPLSLDLHLQVLEGCSPRLEHTLSTTPSSVHLVPSPPAATGNVLLRCFTVGEF